MPSSEASLKCSESVQTAACEALASGLNVFYPSAEEQRELLHELLHEILVPAEFVDTPRAALLLHLMEKLQQPAAGIFFLPSLFVDSSKELHRFVATLHPRQSFMKFHSFSMQLWLV